MTDVSWVEPELTGMPPSHEADHRPDAYMENGRLVLRASSLGGCTKSLIAAGMGLQAEQPPAKIKGAWEESAALEGEVIARGLDWLHDVHRLKAKLLNPNTRTDNAGHVFKPVGGQWAFDLLVGQGVMIRGHIDGLAASYERHTSSPDMPRFVIEAKAFGDEYWKKWLDKGFDAFPEYEAQWAMYRHAGGLPGLYVVGHKENGKITEVDCFVDEESINRDLIIELLRKAKYVAAEVEADALPETCDVKMWPCPMWWLHEDDEWEKDDDPELENMVADYKATMIDHKTTQDYLKELKAAIAERVGAKKVKAGKWKVHVYHSEYPATTREVKAYSTTTVKVEEA
jgi:hypothetical protein